MVARAIITGVTLLAVVGGAAAAAPPPLVLLDGQAAHLEAPALVRDNTVMVWVRDLARIAGGQVYVRSTDGAPVIRRGRTWVAFPAEKAEAEAPGRALPLPVATTVAEGKVMVPLEAGCRALGIACVVEARLVATVSRRGMMASRGAPRLGTVSGRVTFNGRGEAGVVVRLVRADGLTFVRGAQAVSDADGRYEFVGVAPGAYRVYAYIGDNPRYFNRQTEPTRVLGNVVVMADLGLGMVLDPISPALKAKVPRDGPVMLRWSECPRAVEYVLTITDEQTGDEVTTVETRQPEASVPSERFTSGRSYVWRVTATDAAGAFLGSTPGAGGEAWTFQVR